MTRTDIALGLGGSIACVKFTLGFGDLTTAGVTQTITLLENPGGSQVNPQNFFIPANGIVTGVRIKSTVAFAGGAIATMTVSVGKSGGSATFLAPAFDVFQAVADNTLQETGLFISGQMTAWTPVVKFTSTVGNVNAATAGSVDIYIFYIPTTTP